MIRPSTRHDGERQFTGVLRNGRTVVAECGHVHSNRTDSSASGGRSALDCATDLLAAARGEALAVDTAVRIQTSWQRMPAASTADVTRNQAAAADLAATYEQRVAAVRALLDDAAPAPVAARLFDVAPAELTPADAPSLAWMFA